MQSNLFLFENELLKNITDNLPSIDKRVEFYEKCIKIVNIESYDLVRKFAWILSKLYYQKSLGTQSQKNINQSMFEIQQALYFFEQYNHFTNQIVMNPVLTKANFLKQSVFISLDAFQIHSQRLSGQETMLA